MFLIGTLIGVHYDSIHGFLRSRASLSSFIAMAGLALIGAGNFLQGWTHLLVSGNMAIFASLVGIACLAAAAETSILNLFLSSRPIQFLGMVSFSLYLVHEPILIAAARLGRQNPWITIAASFVSVCIAIAFYKIIEKRAHAWSRVVMTKTPGKSQN
jgi:peptidoglycan/LPS O-acetylase OafA/YrhL